MPDPLKFRKQVATRKTTTNPVVSGEVEITIDVDALLNHLGPRALASHSGKATEASGMILVKRIFE